MGEEKLTPQLGNEGRRRMEETMVCTGWLGEQSKTLRAWKRKYFGLLGVQLWCWKHQSVDASQEHVQFSVVYEVRSVQETSSTSLNDLGGDYTFLVGLANGKVLSLKADTRVAYKVWLSSLKEAIQQKQHDHLQIQKKVWVDVEVHQDVAAATTTSALTTTQGTPTTDIITLSALLKKRVRTRYYMVLDDELVNFYRTDEAQAKLTFSGVIRSVQAFTYPSTPSNNSSDPTAMTKITHSLSLLIRLSKAREFVLHFETPEETMAWQIAFQVSYKIMIYRAKKLNRMLHSNKLKKNWASSLLPSLLRPPTWQANVDTQGGVWI